MHSNFVNLYKIGKHVKGVEYYWYLERVRWQSSSAPLVHVYEQLYSLVH